MQLRETRLEKQSNQPEQVGQHGAEPEKMQAVTQGVETGVLTYQEAELMQQWSMLAGGRGNPNCRNSCIEAAACRSVSSAEQPTNKGFD